jgi:DNA-binding response OmpR family regulator
MAWILEYKNAKPFRRDLMPVTSVMMLDGESDRIRCRFICNWFRRDSYVSNKEGLLSEIERNMPDVVVIDLDLYGRIDGIETSRQIRTRFGVPVIYV